MVIIPTEKRFDWKHAPVVLFILVVLNSIIYFGYQFGDDAKAFKAVISYKQHDFIQKEWPIYQKYLEDNNQQKRLKNEQNLYDNMDYIGNEYQLLFSIVADNQFYQYLEENSFNLFQLGYVEKWAVPRHEINEQIQSVSTYSYGLTPNKIGVLTLFTHQFLHGSIMHLLGNMFFLIICGFAVEAAIGHLKFLSFYLISGMTAGFFYSWLDFSSTTPLVGASGAISGVMAMYLGVFRLKKIEFFYWFFVFVGYVRAPALLILPIYIGKEVYELYNNAGSNVAFMAHVGGFIAGSVLMAVAYLINPKMMNEDYIEEDQDIPKIQTELAVVYDNISKFKLNSALLSLDKFIKINGVNFERKLLRFRLLKMQKDKRYLSEMSQLLSFPRLKEYELKQIQQIWINNPIDQKELQDDELYAFAWSMANKTQYNTAEQVFTLLNEKQHRHKSLGNLARKLSVIFEKNKNETKKQKYEQIAQELL